MAKSRKRKKKKQGPQARGFRQKSGHHNAAFKCNGYIEQKNGNLWGGGALVSKKGLGQNERSG